MTPPMTEQKLMHIETTLAHHEQTITELSDLITAQWKEIESLKARLEKTLSKIERLEETMPADSQMANQKPPHY